MGVEKTNIAWTDYTWNPWYGCHKVSSGCVNCYMFREAGRYGRDPNKVIRSKTQFTKPLRIKDPSKIFTCSWSDFWIEEADGWRGQALDIIWKTPQHIYQILTKRPERIAHCLELDGRPLPPNVWLGATVEDVEYFDRIHLLTKIDASVHWLSCEPLVGHLWALDTVMKYCGIDWVVVAGESGPYARPMDLVWARYIHNACRKAKAAFFMKQLGGWPDKRDQMEDFPEDLRVREFPVVK